MLPQHVLLALVAAVSAVPLNINLGAYSPALVVGDGEISLGSTEKASELMATLASGAANTGGQQANQGQQNNQQQQEGQQGEQPAEQPAARAVSAPNLVRTIDHLSRRSPVPEPENENRLAAVKAAMEWIKRDLQGFNAALGYARDAIKETPKIELGTENAGVGILQNAGSNVGVNSAANGAKPAAKRSEVVAPESESPKMTLVAITEV